MTNPRPYSAPYDMRCPIARTLDIVGERWTILILRDLVTGGARKFQDFERSLAEHAIGAIEAAGGSRDRRAAFLRAAPAARRIPADPERGRAAPGAEDLVRLGPAPHTISRSRPITLIPISSCVLRDAILPPLNHPDAPGKCRLYMAPTCA